MSKMTRNGLLQMIVLMILGVATCSQGATLICYKGSLDNSQVVPLESPLPLINSSCIDIQRVTKFFVYGYNRNSSTEESTGIMTAYISRGDVNTVLLDWADEAKTGDEEGISGIIGGYIMAVRNTDKIGKQYAAALLDLADAGLDFEKVHLVGHSLGAQISGIAGNNLKDKGKSTARITGLDPALPLYEGPLADLKGINKDSATFVDIIHSDSGQYGISESSGTADFWPNYKLASKVQPGCPIGLFELLSDDGLCSHIRSWEYFIESIYKAGAFLAAGEPDFPTWIITNGTSDDIARMGEYVSKEAKGNYYLETNDKPPYGKGEDGLYPNREENLN